MADRLAIARLSRPFEVKNKPLSRFRRRRQGPAAKWTKGEKVKRTAWVVQSLAKAAGSRALINTPSGSEEMRQEQQQLAGQGIKPEGLIGGGPPCFKTLSHTFLGRSKFAGSVWDGWVAGRVWNNLEHATGYKHTLTERVWNRILRWGLKWAT